MRISALWEQSGVAVPTIKFYLREGLLPPGVPTGRNQAEYSEAHIERLRLIRTLTSVGGLSLSAVRRILITIDENVSASESAPATDDACATSFDAQVLFGELGWPVDPDSPAVDTIADLLHALRQLGCACDLRMFELCAQAAARIAEIERRCGPTNDSAASARIALLEVVLLELLRIAHRGGADRDPARPR